MHGGSSFFFDTHKWSKNEEKQTFTADHLVCLIEPHSEKDFFFDYRAKYLVYNDKKLKFEPKGSFIMGDEWGYNLRSEEKRSIKKIMILALSNPP